MVMFHVRTAICIILVHLLIKFRLHFLPESVAVVSLGILMGAVIKIIESLKLANWKEEEMFRPNMFFLLLLPPIIFESGYSLHKGNFFQNIGSITLFAVFGTAISAFVVGGGIFFLGQADVIYKLSMTDSFAFGSLISAVDPVATIAIFNALNVDPVLNMLVFGESILNDAVSIVLTNTAEGLTRGNMSDVNGWQTFLQALAYFLKMFFGSAALGTLTGLISALISFLLTQIHLDLRKTPSLEFGMMIIFAYLPYGLSEGISLSGIMAILFAGIVMSHYTHHNLSPVTQILMQQTLRAVAFLCETCVFAFLGLSIFSFPHKFEISFVIWCIVLVLLARAVNIFPLSYLLNFFRDHKINPKMMFIMWFSGKITFNL
ncbi:Sodium hydrogen exchanger 8 [Pelobates cultripes]|uniref:Sodium/hydrogen exchanger n=1 Tax=Pelobates cultripes TaxID=61616 RepID=A0AAD1WGJ2_PELCU|nr:Sodium hydrogen exchanger 8 [Pelobates cultripes]